MISIYCPYNNEITNITIFHIKRRNDDGMIYNTLLDTELSTFIVKFRWEDVQIQFSGSNKPIFYAKKGLLAIGF